MRRYDVAIVGGSCAGAAAGYRLASAGKSVLIIDKAAFPRTKLCGGMLTEKTVSILTDVYGAVSFENIITARFSTYGIYHANMGKICRVTSPSPSLYLVERETFDHYFLQKAESAGCTVLTGHKVVGVRDRSVLLESGENYSADNICGADGCFSIVRRTMFPKRAKRKAAIAVEVDVPLELLSCYDDRDGIFPKIYFGYAKYGYGWVFPRKTTATVGICGLIGSNRNVRDLLSGFVQTIMRRDLDAAGLTVRGFPIPFNNFLDKPAQKNVFLLGDAAGLIDPVTGEGICFAVLSGKLAADALLADGDPADAYNDLIGRNIHRVLNQGYIARHFLYYPRLHEYAMYKMKRNAKYCKYSFPLLSGEMDYLHYAVSVLRDKGKYASE